MGEALLTSDRESKTFIVEPVPGKFKYAYQLYIPEKLDWHKTVTPFVWAHRTERGNYDGIKARTAETFREIRRELSDFNCIGIVPVLPEKSESAAHYADSQTLSFGTFILQPNDFSYRPDEDLILFLDYLSDVAEREKVNLDKKIVIGGGSAGANFANRFTVLHPEKVKASAVFVAGDFCYPETTLPYPFGTTDLPEGTWSLEKREQFLNIPHFVFYGTKDDAPENDPFTIDAHYIPLNEREKVLEVVGREKVQRAINYIAYLRNNHASVTELALPLGHETTAEVLDRFNEFLKKKIVS